MITKLPISCILVITVLLSSGCQMPSETTTSKPKRSFLDDTTAERMHDVCGSLLLFQNAYKRLPDSLDELSASTGLTEKQITDPATGKRFWYTPKGFARSSEHGLIVLLAEPASPNDICYGIAMWGTLPSLNSRVVPLEAGAWEKLTAGWEAAP